MLLARQLLRQGFRKAYQRVLLPVVLAALCCLASLVLVRPAAADTTWNVGFTAINLSLPAVGKSPAINVWYPTTSRRSRSIPLNAWTFRAARDAAVAPGQFPLVLLSHPSAGSRFTHHNTAKALASHGFIVAVPTHAGDNLDHMPGYGTWAVLHERRNDLVQLADMLLAHERFAASIAPDRLGVLGFGSGGTAALLLGGALPDCSLWQEFCKKSRSVRDPYCNDWAQVRIRAELCPSLPLRPSLADTRFKAVAAVEPGYTLLFSKEALAYFHPPLLLVFGERKLRDSAGSKEPSGTQMPGTHPKRAEEGGATEERPAVEGAPQLLGSDQLAALLYREHRDFAARFAVKPAVRIVDKADLNAFMAPCPDELLEGLPELCYSVNHQEREIIHEQLMASLVDFFTRTLVSASPRPIPDPPSFELVGPTQPPARR